MSTAPYESRHSQLTKIVKRLGINKHVVKTIANRNQQVAAMLMQKKAEPEIKLGKARQPDSSFASLYNLQVLNNVYEVDRVQYIFTYEPGYFLFLNNLLHEIIYILTISDEIIFFTATYYYEKDDFHVANRIISKREGLNRIEFNQIHYVKPMEKILAKKDNHYYLQF